MLQNYKKYLKVTNNLVSILLLILKLQYFRAFFAYL